MLSYKILVTRNEKTDFGATSAVKIEVLVTNVKMNLFWNCRSRSDYEMYWKRRERYAFPGVELGKYKTSHVTSNILSTMM